MTALVWSDGRHMRGSGVLYTSAALDVLRAAAARLATELGL